jgi:serine/threonine protein kinase/Tol biopolymer transport system component
MTPDRWREIEELYHAARTDRAVLTGADPELRREVESLLAQDASKIGGLDRPAWDRGAGVTMVTPAQVGPYKIEGLLGEGGMGVVYRALDTKLNRPVAIKFLSEELADPAARRRFQREAQMASSLNHPHILTVHDAGEFEGRQYLVTELVDGGTLKDWANSDKRTWRQIVELLTGVADGLATAHQAGVLHRDIKPGNILVSKNGYAKLADFGLAKLDESSLGDRTRTLTEKRTTPGLVIGTIAYMSPEQASGRAMDARSDIFSFGVVLFELLAGQRPFTGATDLEVLQKIIHADPKLLGEGTPAALRAIVEKALEKDPDERYQSMRELVVDLRRFARRSVDAALPGEAPTSRAQSGSQSAIAASPPDSGKKKWLWPSIAAGVIVAGAALAIVYAPWRKPMPTQAVRFEVGPAEKMTFINQASMAVSPDGRWMVFPATGEDGVIRYYLRALDGVEVRALAGAEGGQSPASWSYDSRWVVFANGGGKLKKVNIQGGPPQIIADFPSNNLGGASWNSEGVIIEGREGSPIHRAPASGGQETPVTALAPGESAHRWPQFLPDGKHFLYQRASSDPAQTGVYIGSIDAPPNQQSTQRLLATNRQAYYAPGGGAGHLIFLQGYTLMAQPFDPNRMILSGEPVAITDGVDSYSSTNHGLFSVSDTGTLVFRGGSGPQSVLTWFDQQGNPAGTLGDPGDYAWPAISPDGSRVAVAIGSQSSRDIWILDVARGSSTRFTFDPARDDTPAWSPDGKNIAFTSNRGGQLDLYVKPADGSGEERLLLKTDEYKILQRWTKDGRFLLFDSTGPKTAQDVWALPFPSGQPVPLVQTQFIERWARVSPDGRWLAYTSNESGPDEIYVRPFTPGAPAGTGAKWLVSKGGGIRPLWRPDGKEVFYVTAGGEVMGVDIDTNKGFQAGTPRRMFTAPPGVLGVGWDLSPDGKHFLFVAPPNAGRVVPFTVVLNWAAGLKK